MSIKIIQRKNFTIREAEIMETKMTYKSTFFGKDSQITIPYEDLSRQKEAYVLNRQTFYIPVLIFGLFTFASYMWKDDKDFNSNIWILWGVLLIISTIVYILSVEKLWKIRVQYNRYLFFFRDKPSITEVDEFIESLFLARDRYLRETYYLNPNKNLPYENQKSNLQWLRKSEVITGAEFQSSIKQLDTIFSQDLKKIGFN